MSEDKNVELREVVADILNKQVNNYIILTFHTGTEVVNKLKGKFKELKKFSKDLGRSSEENLKKKINKFFLSWSYFVKKNYSFGFI